MFSKISLIFCFLVLAVACYDNTPSGDLNSGAPDSPVVNKSGNLQDSVDIEGKKPVTANSSSGRPMTSGSSESSENEGSSAITHPERSTTRSGQSGFGNIAIYCSREMQEGLEYDIAVVLSKILSRESLRERTAEEISRTSPTRLTRSPRGY